METGNFIKISQLAAQGKGVFTPRNRNRKHVLVIGGIYRERFSQCSD